MSKFGIDKSTVSDINENREKILSFMRKMVDMGMKKQAKVMKASDNRRLEDQAVFLVQWRITCMCEVTGKRKLGKGLKVLCVYKFYVSNRLIQELRKQLKNFHNILDDFIALIRRLSCQYSTRGYNNIPPLLE